MSNTPNHSYRGHYYYNPYWIKANGSNPPSLVYGNMVHFTVGPDGTHYFHQTYTGQFVAPASQTVEIVDSVPPSCDEGDKTKAGQASKSGDKEAGRKEQKGQGSEEQKSQETQGEDEDSSDEDVWATEDEDYYDDNGSDSSQEEYNRGPSRDYSRDRRRPLRNRRDSPARSPRREVDARSTIVSLVPKEFQLN